MKQTLDKKFSSYSFNARLLLKEMDKRGMTVTRIRKTKIVSVTHKGHSELLYDLYSNVMPYTKGIIIDDKYHAKKFLQKKGFSVNEGQVFLRSEIQNAVQFALSVGFPVVLKPVMSSHGEHVIMNINTPQELRQMLKEYFSKYTKHTYCLIEKQFSGNEYRLFITKDNFFAAVHRLPASITGDGIHTIQELIRAENFRRMNPRNTCLCRIAVDAITKRELKNQNLCLSSVPEKRCVVKLRFNSNISTGGNCYDVTDRVHPSFIALSKKILLSLDVPFIGIDMLCADISLIVREYAICELNTYPGISLHMMPEKGKKRDVAKAIVDVIFPETKSL